MTHEQAKAETMAAKEAVVKALEAAGFGYMAFDLGKTYSADGLHRIGRTLLGYADIPGAGKVMAAAERLNLAIGAWFQASVEIAEKSA